MSPITRVSKIDPPVLELILQQALEMSIYSDFEDSSSQLGYIETNEPVKFDPPTRNCLLTSRWESGRKLDEYEADLKNPRRQGTNEDFQTTFVKKQCAGLRIPHRRSSNDSDTYNKSHNCHPESITRSERCFPKPATSTAQDTSKFGRRGSFTMNIGQEHGSVTKRGSFTMTITDHDDCSLTLEDAVRRSRPSFTDDCSVSTSAPKRPTRRSSIVLAFSEDTESSIPALKTNLHRRESKASCQCPRRPCRTSSIALEFDYEDASQIDLAQAIPTTTAASTRSNSAVSSAAHLQTEEVFGSTITGSYVRETGSSFFMHQNGSVMLTFAGNSGAMSPATCHVPNGHLILQVSSNSRRKGGVSKKLPTRSPLFQTEQHVSAIEEDEPELDYEFLSSKIDSDVSLSANTV